MKKVADVLKKALLWKPSVKLLAGIFVLMFAVMLLPLMRLALYSVPWYDDYMYGYMAKAWMIQLDSPWGAIVGAIDCARTEWYIWQGTYASGFFMALMPAIWGEENYFWGPVFIMVLLTVAIFVLVKVLVRDVLKADRASCVVMQAVTSMMVIMLIHTAQGGFYWYIGGIHYVGMHSVCILLVACVICLLRAEKKWTTVVLVICSMAASLIVAGSNYVTTLQGALLFLSLFIFGMMRYRKKALLLLPGLCVYGAGFYHNITAPGNDRRAASFSGMGCSPMEAIWRSFVEAFRYAGEFTGFITVAILIMLVPVIWYMVKRCNFCFRYPAVLLLWSFCLYATGFTPSLFSMGNAGLSRTLNAVKITWQILLLINEVYLLGWLEAYLRKKGKEITKDRVYWWFYPIMGVFMLLIFAASPNKAGCYSAYGAYYYIHSGEAYNFHQEYLQRLELLKSDESDVVLEPYRYRPWFLCSGDLSENPDAEPNMAIAKWYGKKSVTVQEPKAEK